MPVPFLLSAMWLSGRAFVVDNFHVTGRKMTVWQVAIFDLCYTNTLLYPILSRQSGAYTNFQISQF